MKKILGLAFGLMIGALTYAQSPVTFTEDMSSYDKTTTTVFHFNFDETIAAEDIIANADYYTDYFTISSTPVGNKHDVTITLVNDDDMSRKVVHRYFATLQVGEINVNGSDIPTKDFIETYIQK